MTADITPSPEASALANNLDALAANGHTNLDPVLQATLAQNGSTKTVLANAGVMQAAGADSTATRTLSDPVVNQQPSLLQKAASFLHNQYGPVPLLTSDVTSVQQSLQSKGYAQGLTPGAWNSQWQAALNQHAYDASVAPGVGNVKSLPLWEKVLQQIAPNGWSSTIVHAVGHYIANLPNEGRQLLSDLGGEIAYNANPVHTLQLLNPWIDDKQAAAYDAGEGKVTAEIENALGGHVDPATLTEKQRTMRAVQDLGLALNLVSAASAGKAVVSSVGLVGKAVTENALAGEGITTAAKDLVTRSLPAEVAATPSFPIVKTLYQTTPEGSSGLLRFMENVPVLKRMLPAVDALDAEGSKYYAFRNFQASLMRNPIWQVAAKVQAKGSLTGLAMTGIGETEKKLGVTGANADLAAPYQGAFANAVNTASMFMGAPTIGLKASQNVGQIVDAAHGALTDALGPINMDYVVKKGLGIPLAELQKNLGTEFVNDHFLNTKVNQFAASHYAENMLQDAVNAGTVDKNSTEATKLFSQYEHEALSDPTGILAQSRESLVRQPLVLANYFRKDQANILGLNVRKGIEEPYDITAKNKDRFYAAMNNLKAAHSDVATMLQDEHRNLFHGSSTQTNVADLLSNALRENWGKRQVPFNDLVKTEDNRGDWEKFLAPGSPVKVMKAEAQPPLYHVNGKVAEAFPEPKALATSNRYGSGVRATDDAAFAGRSAQNVYTLRYKPTDNENPTFLDLRAKNANAVADKIKEAQGTNQFRDDLGLMQPGKGKDTLVGVDKSQYSKEYKNLAKMLKNTKNYSGQDILDAYRDALGATGKLSAKQIDDRIAGVTSGAVTDGGHAGYKFLDSKGNTVHVVNPEKTVANITQLDPSLTKESLIPGYLSQNNTVARGALGIARKDTFIQQDAQKAANKFFARLANDGHENEVSQARSTLQIEGRQLAKDPMAKVDNPLPKIAQENLSKESLNVLNEARGILIKKLGFSPLEVNKLDPIGAVSLLWRESRNLASEAFLPVGAPKVLTDAVDRLAEKGYRPVLGTDIGHAYERPILHPVIADQRTSLLRRSALALKLDPTKVSDITVAQSRDIAQKTEVDKLFASGKVQTVMGDSSSTVLNILRDYARSGASTNKVGNKVANAIRGWGQGKREQLVTQLMGDTDHMTVAEERELKLAAEAKAQEIFGAQRRVTDLSFNQMVKALTQPIAKAGKDYLGNTAPRYSVEDARKIAKAVMVGTAKAPGYTMGLGKSEDFIRASGAMATNATASFFGKVPLLKNYKIGEGPIANAITSLPSNLTALRNQWRFDLNPIFAYRRLAKTNIKAATEGIPLARNPYQAMVNLGIKDDAYKVLQSTMPKVYQKAEELDSLDRFLQQNDVFNVYNPAHNMAWQAYHLKQMGYDDATITQKLEKINTYGDRSPLERTVNTVFYPFSFNKTLYKNIGGYILDHPGEAALLNAGFQLYNHLDPNNQQPGNGLQGWFNKYLPVIQDLQKLNAFEHGTGLGQFGGINAPYLQQTPYIKEFMNLFSPQAVTPANAPGMLKTMTQMVPALNELNGLLFNVNLTTGAANPGGVGSGRLVEAAKTGFWATQNLLEHSKDLYKHFRDQKTNRVFYTSPLPDAAQIQAGSDVVSALKVQLAGLMGTGQTWPTTDDVPKAVRGLPYNAASFEQYAHAMYPAYTPGGGVGVAVQKAAAAVTYVQNLQGTFRYDAYKQFQTDASKVVTKLSRTTDAAAIQNMTAPIRDLAVNIAEQDPQFIQFYNKFFESALGPIEGLKK